MRQLYQEYSKNEILGQLVPELKSMFVPIETIASIIELLSLIPWGQNLVIMQKIKDFKERLFYIIQNIKIWMDKKCINKSN